jgi:predicted membrane channel-forming protein YqfA (hemolysin III family)
MDDNMTIKALFGLATIFAGLSCAMIYLSKIESLKGKRWFMFLVSVTMLITAFLHLFQVAHPKCPSHSIFPGYLCAVIWILGSINYLMVVCQKKRSG